ncbi:NAD(P)-dependent alcohol dehydrogenase [Olivibacter ginsenosidimutans]
MKAAVLERVGHKPWFKVKDMPRPSLRKGQVLVQNFASSTNPVDVLMRQGKAWLATAGVSNQVIGCDFCGVVTISKSPLFKVGDDVFGMCSIVKGGAYAEEVVVDANQVALKPANLTYIEAGVIPLVGLTAYQALFGIGKLQERENVLITGCTGGVGSAAVQLARSLNCHISGLCSEKHRSDAHNLGCDVVIDYKNQKIPSGARFNLIFDAAGKYTYSDLKHHLIENGIFITTRGETHTIKGMVRTAVDVVLEPQMKMVFVKASAIDLNKIKEIIEQNVFKIPVASVFSLEQIKEAHQLMEKGGFVGKIGIKI